MGRYGSPERTRRRSYQSPSGSGRRQSGGDARGDARSGHKRGTERGRSRSRSHSHSRSRSRSSSFGDDERGYRLHIADLAPDSTRKDLEIAFQKFGHLQEVWMARSPQCFAFVVYQHWDDARDAIEEMHGKKFCGQRIRVTKARPRTRGQRTYRSYNPNLRCYECGKKGHFSRDCRLNDHTNPKNRDVKTMSVKDLINWDITDDDIIQFNTNQLEQSQNRSRSRSTSSSSSAESRKRKRSRHHSSDSSNRDPKDENANSTKAEKEERINTSMPATAQSPTLESQPQSVVNVKSSVAAVPAGMANTFSPVNIPIGRELPGASSTGAKLPEVRTVIVTKSTARTDDVLDISLPGSDAFS